MLIINANPICHLYVLLFKVMSTNLYLFGYENLSFTVHSHELVVSDDLDCHLLAGPRSVPGPDHIAEHALTSVAIHIIALVQCLPNVHP